VSVAIVTGAGGAIGRAIATRLAAEGQSVLCVDISHSVREFSDELRETGAGGAACVLDLSEQDAPTRILEHAEALGETTTLVNNAGITRDGRSQTLSEEDFRLVTRTNLLAPLRLAEAAAPRIKAGGTIINIASRAALGNFGQANYVAAKSALIGATRALAIKWAPSLRVNAVAPGLIDTPMTRSMPPAVLSKLIDAVPARRAGEPAEIAEVVSFLASSRSSYITGQLLLACGGRSIAA
jgi:3-oxoacyl-[acyl-carrier protein] reductase